MRGFMTYLFKCFKKSLLVIVTIMFPAAIYSQQVSFYIGDVKAVRDSKKLTVNMGTVLQSGDVITTGKGGTVEIIYKDRSKITIQPKSRAIIGSKSIKGSSNVTLVSGNLSGKFTKLKKSKRKVYTPTTICAIRGTEFDIGVSRGGDSKIDLSEGKLEINNPYGKTDLNEGQSVRAIVSEKPDRTEKKQSMKDFQLASDRELQENPDKKKEQYNKYVDKFKDRSSDAGKDVSQYDKMVRNASGEKGIEEAGDKISNAEESIEDDLLLNEASIASIDGIMNDFKSRKNNIYKKFRKLKEESNKVREQQQRNYEAIQAVKEAHRKAYEKIMGKFKDDRDRIFKGVDMDSVKPKIKKK